LHGVPLDFKCFTVGGAVALFEHVYRLWPGFFEIRKKTWAEAIKKKY
jgi:hypothetical protein